MHSKFIRASVILYPRRVATRYANSTDCRKNGRSLWIHWL